MNITVFGESIPIVVVESKEQLMKAAAELQQSKILAVDTEFDRMRTRYGMNLDLIQIFDQKQVYLIRVARLKDIQALKQVIEDKKVLKLIYSAEQDIEAIKSHKVDLQGLYDLQVAAKLAEANSPSFIGLAEEILGIKIDKKQQKSDWDRRKLRDEQIMYAAEDVAYHFHLYNVLKEKVRANKKEDALKLKNEALERTQPVDFTPQLKGKDFGLNESDRQKKLKLLELTDQIAKSKNVPLYYVFGNAFLDSILSAGDSFESVSLLKGCPKRYKESMAERTWIDERIKQILRTK